MIRCAKCGSAIQSITTNFFAHNGSDYDRDVEFNDDECGICFEVPEYWCGNGLSEEEMRDCIKCPRCGKFPLQERSEVASETVVRVVCVF